ncbi:MAG TPA: hypothetical protein VNI77_11145 [Nitrososphaera sp.]|nr:hypothetical protein [Nitrososphaera sp.]
MRPTSVIAGLAVTVLIFSIGMTGLAAYTFIVVLPPALDSLNEVGWELINYNPGTEGQFYSSSSGLRDVGTKLQNFGDSLPCSENGGCIGLIDLSSQRSQLNDMGSSLQALAGNMQNIGDDFGHTVNLIHSVGYTALALKDGLYFGSVTVLGLGIGGILTGVALVSAANAVKNLEKAALLIYRKKGV